MWKRSKDNSPDHQALTLIRKQTTFLWPALQGIKPEQSSLMCQVRESTFRKISPSLTTLSTCGHFRFFVTPGYPFKNDQVLNLHLVEIAPSFRELIQQNRSPEESPPTPMATPTETG